MYEDKDKFTRFDTRVGQAQSRFVDEVLGKRKTSNGIRSF